MKKLMAMSFQGVAQIGEEAELSRRLHRACGQRHIRMIYQPHAQVDVTS